MNVSILPTDLKSAADAFRHMERRETCRSLEGSCKWKLRRLLNSQ